MAKADTTPRQANPLDFCPPWSPPVSPDMRMVKPGDPQTIGIMRDRYLREELRMSEEERAYMLHLQVRDMQQQIGEGLVDYIWRTGGISQVRMSYNEVMAHDSWDERVKMVLQAEIHPAYHLHEVVRSPVRHFEYFPADWWCPYCNRLNDGLKQPRICEGCGGSRDRSST